VDAEEASGGACCAQGEAIVSCGKVRYEGEAAAKRALRDCQRKGGRHRERRVYLCRDCHGFHLTKERSNEERHSRLIRRVDDAPFDPRAAYFEDDVFA
jgi:hypothetical protein